MWWPSFRQCFGVYGSWISLLQKTNNQKDDYLLAQECFSHAAVKTRINGTSALFCFVFPCEGLLGTEMNGNHVLSHSSPIHFLKQRSLSSHTCCSKLLNILQSLHWETQITSASFVWIPKHLTHGLFGCFLCLNYVHIKIQNSHQKPFYFISPLVVL